MRFTDSPSSAGLRRRRELLVLPLLPLLTSACGVMGGKAEKAAAPEASPPPAPAQAPAVTATAPAPRGSTGTPAPATPSAKGGTAAKDGAPAPAPRPAAPMPLARNWEDYKRQAARRIVAANPEITHTGKVQQPSLAIPVLEIELAGDGSIVRVDVLRPPREARHTVQIAIDAVRRAGPLPPVAHLPKPWKFTESFLFNDDGRFKPSALNR